MSERALLPGDPGRALRLAQELLRDPRMLNHNRGLWGYTGPAPDGAPLTIQSTGLGGPSAAVVVHELVALGAERLVRVGTCVAATDDLRLGELVVAERVLAADGVSRALDAPGELRPDAGLAGELEGRPVTLASRDLFYGDGAPADAWDLQTAAVLAVARRLGVRAAAVLLVTQDATGRRLDGDDLHAAEQALGRAGAVALGAA